MDVKEVIGYRVKLHSSLIMPMLLSGASRRFVLLNGTLCAVVVLGLQLFYLLPLFIILQIFVVFLTKKDPYFFDVLRRNMKYQKYYLV